MIKTCLAIILGLLPCYLFSQNMDHQTSGERCGTVQITRQIESAHPELKYKRESFERSIHEILNNEKNKQTKTKEIITIPVVVHVVWNTPEQNLSATQVWSQFNVLNEDFRRQNPDTIHTPAMFKPLAADCEIEFCLAKRGPTDTVTNGIIRVHTDVTEFPMDNSVKNPALGGSKAWDPKKYLNIWICHMAGNVLGYAQYPGGPDSTDGVVIDYQCFGNVGDLNPHYNKGRTATHEIGHWLDLYHIWGDDFGSCDGTDYVDDTPNAKDANYYCPSHPRTTSCNPTGEMFMNYMDYVDDGCFNLFTTGQKERMLAAIMVSRPELLTSNGCEEVIGINEQNREIKLEIFPNPCSNLVNLRIAAGIPQELTISVQNMLGKEVLKLSSCYQANYTTPIDVSNLPAGIYLVRVGSPTSANSIKMIVTH